MTEQEKIAEAGKAIADALTSVSTDDRGDVLIEAALQLRRHSQFATAALIERAGVHYNGM